MYRMLLIDDCEDVGLLVEHALQPYEIVQARTIAEAESLLQEQDFALIMIDVGMPDGDGFAFCQKLSQDPRIETIPRILLTGESEVSQRVYGLYCGADDYVTKPFVETELKARVDSKLRRAWTHDKEAFTVGDFKFDTRFMKCIYLGDQRPIDLGLTPTEFRILYALALNSGSPLSRHELVQAIFRATQTHIAPRGIDSHICHIRKKLPPEGAVVSVIYSRGYVLEVQNSRVA